ncbi:low molecular weight phosphatase family protein [Isoptericola sp. b490]|uniref:arsenate reductase/protein-tyrosine-phosphatase family protein n=1 Tax=Actinotalea lenta TaxID=3064654 RepID=UPI0027123743|nr:low molecular weight phosphatase family protein [Isoptericola sp. b490]MDO8119928.1 low molecular weight phosphatase family protein [Isoptericola sp. b490]
MPTPPGPVSILVVCTGNICRSPAAAAVLAARLPDARVRSAGTRALVGAPADPRMAQVAGEDGFSLAEHRGTALSGALVAEADLVLTMTREHRSAVVSGVPAALRRTFTLAELARLLPSVPRPQDVHGPGGALVEASLAAVRLRRTNPAGPEADDIDDPYGRSMGEYRRAYREIRAALDAMAP